MVFNRRTDTRPAPVVPNAAPARVVDATTGSVRTAEASAPPESVIGPGFVLEGNAITIRCRGALRVDGNIHADLHTTWLTVGKDAVISGAIAAEQVDVYGQVRGAIRARHLVLHSTAEVEGDLVSHELTVEQGASFDGRSRKAKDPAEIEPQLDGPAAKLPAPQPVQHAAPQVHAVPLPNGPSKILHS
jgi:cytoskeletal protein CcmA (bactofilin family)